jgi:hypothetical protein
MSDAAHPAAIIDTAYVDMAQGSPESGAARPRGVPRPATLHNVVANFDQRVIIMT